MPILAAEPDCFPDDVLLDPAAADDVWWACYTRSRQEKQLMRRLRAMGAGYYSPVIQRRYRSPAGRVRVTHLPLFANYVFLRGDNQARYDAVSTGCVSRYLEVKDPHRLVADLRQIQRLIATEAPLAPEARIEPGHRVRVKNGQFAGFEGIVVRREKETRLVVEVHFMNQGASVALDDCQLEELNR